LTHTAPDATLWVKVVIRTMKIGYIRCSTEEQNEARQVMLLKEHGVEKLYIDKASGKNTNREAFREMMSFVRAGDLVVCESISRIARNVRDLLNIITQLSERGVEFFSMKESIDTTTPQGRFMLTVFGAMAELERESILERQREGIAIAKAEGKYKGRQRMKIDEQWMKNVCKRWRDGEINAREAMTQIGLKPNTFYRRVKEMGL